MRKVRWGVLGVARIAVNRVIPGMQAGELSEISAIASRDLARADEAARQLGIGRSLLYELLADGQVESIHVGRLRRIPADALAAYIDRQRPNRPDMAM